MSPALSFLYLRACRARYRMAGRRRWENCRFCICARAAPPVVGRLSGKEGALKDKAPEPAGWNLSELLQQICDPGVKGKPMARSGSRMMLAAPVFRERLEGPAGR